MNFVKANAPHSWRTAIWLALDRGDALRAILHARFVHAVAAGGTEQPEFDFDSLIVLHTAHTDGDERACTSNSDGNIPPIAQSRSRFFIFFIFRSKAVFQSVERILVCS